ncbi:hypothetical protein ACIP6P_00660 [Streptomyces sp. NPDC088729]|uniref:hypothetical protein n=1 Tax=Streptomyces sp. NPDC088729 TaxID=3365876 RepID=UPI003814638F
MNIQLGSGKVHAASETPGHLPLPKCGGNKPAERYHATADEVNCKACFKVVLAELGAEIAADEAAGDTTPGNPEVVTPDAPESATVSHVSNTNRGETEMAETTTTKLDVTEEAGRAALEQIDANIERARSLAEADNAEALEELGAETESIISALVGKGSIKAKKEKRAEWTAAAVVPEKAVKKVTEGKIAPKTWDQYEGTQELINLGAEKLAEGVRLNLKASTVAAEVAAVTFDAWTRMENKAGDPDLLGAGDASKKFSGAMLRLAGDGFERTYDNEKALEKLARSAQDQRSDVRAAWLRSLDEDTEQGAERRALVAKKLEGKPEDVPASEWIAKAYNTSTIGQTEKRRLEYQAKQKAAELESAQSADGDSDAEGGEGEGSDASADNSTPDERITKFAKKLLKDVGTAKPEDFEVASDETKKAAREQFTKAIDALKAMVQATL